MVEAPFVWGRGGSRLTPDQIARLREQEAAQTGAVDTSPVGHWTQGAARVANALAGVIKSKRLDKAEGENATYNSGLLDQLFGGGETTKFPAAPSMGGAPVEAAAGGGASIPTGERASYIRSGLVQRGLPEHVADGFVVNFQDESGLDPGINERNPIVPGSRGGFGLYQLTGPRRVAYENFAQQRGVDPSDIDAQLDFMMTELQGSEAKAAQNILQAPDTATAAQAIVKDFLRPSEQYRDSRMAKYAQLGGSTPMPADPAAGMMSGPETAFAPTAQPTDALAAIEAQAPASGYVDPMVSAQPGAAAPLDAMAAQAQQMPQPAPMASPAPNSNGLDPMVLAEAIRARGGDPNRGIFPVIAGLPGERNLDQQTAQANPQQLLRAISDPMATDATKRIAQALYEQQMAQMQSEQEYQREISDPAYKLDLEKRQLEIDAMRNPKPEVPKPTDDMREYEFARSQGFDGTFSDYQTQMKRAGSQTINLGGGSDKQVFDTMAESAVSARSAITGLNSLREAKAAVEGGIISGAGADARLGLQKVGALLGVADPSVIENTETFRAAIAPQVAAVMKATVGSTQISNADREFAERAAGGSINLDERSIRRLVDIMERAGAASVQSHMERLDKVYPEGQGFERERALFGVTLPEIAPAAPAPGGAEPSIDDLLKIYGK